MDSGRDRIVDYARKQLVGPVLGEDEVLRDPPTSFYVSGALYPLEQSVDEQLEDEEEERAEGYSGPNESGDDPVSLANQWMPGALGLSFFLADGDAVQVRVEAARYSRLSARKWARESLASRDAPEIVRIAATDAGQDIPVLDSLASLSTVWRNLPGGYLVTVTLVNRQTGKKKGKQADPTQVLFQTGFRCLPEDGCIREYPNASVIAVDHEEEELELRHRHARAFAIGHGCAAMWDTSAEDHVEEVYTTGLPTFEMRPIVTAGDFESEALKINMLVDFEVPDSNLIQSLEAFVDGYHEWVNSLPLKVGEDLEQFASAVERIVERHSLVLKGMRHGIRVLKDDRQTMRAFRLANLAMLIQMTHSDVIGQNRVVDDPSALPDLFPTKRWYPFQLAFQLLVLPSLTGDSEEDRELVDLIWFPTGGGKTEAYLAVAAFEIFRRRLVSGDRGAGTAVISRYTLRLLTNQQFRRAAMLICACEILRRKNSSDLGSSPISIGLWVGGGATPNRYQDAIKTLDDMLESEEDGNPFQIGTCPWCGETIVPKAGSRKRSNIGIEVTNVAFRFFCVSDDCPFSDGLPVSVVDDDLYKHPPSFLMGTVDKFAQLAWSDRATAFFGRGDAMPPSLIIQDELHLLSGPLGTTMGLYESAIETVIGIRGGALPKIIASTATIRRAEDQCRALFGKGVRLFPAPGVDSRDSYFAQTDEGAPGRLYAGLMSQSHRPTTTLIRISASLLQSINELELSDSDTDLFSTLVIYHNSLRELGMTVTFARDDIPARIKAIASSDELARAIDDYSVVELTSNRSAAEIPSVLDRMANRYGESDHVDILVCTNMLSVGIDVQRLSLMVVNGQPKASSEYIQATSRVGRTEPGLVFTHYSPTKPRDRSHYESFLPYHSAAYRHVEPTSATPFASPSRDRALHAALVILIRHATSLGTNEGARDFRKSSPEVVSVLGKFRKHIAIVDPKEAGAAIAHLERLVNHWDSLARNCKKNGEELRYNADGSAIETLLRRFGNTKGDGWRTLDSMRNVDRFCGIEVAGAER